MSNGDLTHAEWFCAGRPYRNTTRGWHVLLRGTKRQIRSWGIFPSGFRTISTGDMMPTAIRRMHHTGAPGHRPVQDGDVGCKGDGQRTHAPGEESTGHRVTRGQHKTTTW